MTATHYQKPDMHMHSLFSDGTDSAEELLCHVREAGLDIFALTDHDTFEGCVEVQKNLLPSDPKFVCGVEYSCKDETGKYHILGYDFDPQNPAIVSITRKMYTLRIGRVNNILALLKQKMGIVITPEERAEIACHCTPGKPHIVALLLKKGIIKTREEGFALMHDLGAQGNVYLSPCDAVEAITKSNGYPVLAHGILGDGSSLLSEEEIRMRVERLLPHGLKGLECYYSGYTESQQSIMLKLAEQYNLFVTAGSDYHGSNKTISLGYTQCPQGIDFPTKS